MLLAVEVMAVATGAASVWLLASNRPLGWWVGLVSVALFAVLFAAARLYGEVAIQIFYFVTSLQAIWVWLRGGPSRTERPVQHLPIPLMALTLPLIAVATLALRPMLVELRGAAPFWDALTTVTSVAAHLYLVFRYVESWYLWIAVDVVYVPLYLSRDLELTALLYVAFLILSVRGLLRFRREAEGATA
jgi:nicotinamide mononucleotide transporter